jgi:hypothetical protein
VSEKETTYAADAAKPVAPYTGCAECAFKHFTAAMALLDLCDLSSSELWAAESDVMLARAEILAAEAEHGYPEARVLVVGCLAAAETGVGYGKAEAIRASRKDYMRGVGLEAHEWTVPYAARLFAHILEGLREYPKGLSQTRGRGTALLEIVLLDWREDSQVTAVSACDVERLRDALDREARRLADLYELFRKPETPDETMRRGLKAPLTLPTYLREMLLDRLDKDTYSVLAPYINAELGGIVPDGSGVPLKSGPSSTCNNGGPTL